MYETLCKHIENNDLTSFNIEFKNHHVSNHQFVDLFLLSAKLGHLDILKYLQNRSRSRSDTIITVTIYNGHRFPTNFHYKEKAILVAARGGHVDIIKYLFRINPKIDYRAKDNEALSAAASRGYLEIVKLLIEREDLNPQYKKGIKTADINTAYNRAAKNGHAPILQYLETLNNPNFDYTIRNVSTFRSACNSGQVTIVEHSLKNPFINPAADDFVALRGAIGWKAENSQDVIELLAQWIQSFGSKEECERQEKILEAYGITVKDGQKAKTSSIVTFGGVFTSTDDKAKDTNKGKQARTKAQAETQPASPIKKDKELEASQRQNTDQKEEQKEPLLFRDALRVAAHPRGHERHEQGPEHKGLPSHTVLHHDERRTHHKSRKGERAHP